MGNELRKYNKKDKWTGERYTRWGWDFNDEAGKRHRVAKYFTRAEAGEALKIYKKTLEEKNQPQDKNLLFKDLAEKFLKSHAEVNCAKATINKYTSIINTHLNPCFGEKKAASILPMDINDLRGFLQKEKKLAEKSINHVTVTLKTIFNFGIDNELLIDNPCKKIKKLRLPHKEKNFLDKKQVATILETCKTESPSFYPILYTAIFTGMRKGEISALTWKDIDFKAKKIRVNKSMYKNEVQKTKTEHSVRKVDMIDSLAEVLTDYRKNTPLRGEYVFWGESGTPLSGDATLWRHFNRIITKCGLKDITFHDMRHTYASLLITNNVPIKYIQKQLGHSTINMTMDTYGHLLPDVYDQARGVLENIAKNSFGHANGTQEKDKSPQSL